MIVLHAIWTNGTLEIWGERCAEGLEGSKPADRVGETEPVPRFPGFVDRDSLRRCIGDVCDTLLVSGANASELVVRLPHWHGQLVPSRVPPGSPTRATESDPCVLLPCRIPTLSFTPADAVDLLASPPVRAGRLGDDICAGESLGYWSRFAMFVLELLAGQRLVPAVHHCAEEEYRGYWRVVVADDAVSDRLGKLIASMPPVCRAAAEEGEPSQASTIVESFLWKTVDALVRRCLEADDLAHAILDKSQAPVPRQMWWLKALVGPEPRLQGDLEDRRAIFRTVQAWLSRIEPKSDERVCRVCFRLHPPGSTTEPLEEGVRDSWELTLQVQATHDPKLVVDATRLLTHEHAEPPWILRRPFHSALPQLRADVARAARHFPPLAVCAEETGPLALRLTVEEAYSFLRDAAPILELEGFGVTRPPWWSAQRPRLRLWLELRPRESDSPITRTPIGLDAIVAYDWRVAVGDEELSLEELKALASAQEPLARVKGRWTEVQASEIQTALDFLSRRQAGEMTVSEALRQCYIADDLDTGLPMAGLRAHGWVEHLLTASHIDDAAEPVACPAGFQGTLRPYQARGLAWLAFLSRLGLGACLADDMGLGKTIQLIALWLHEREGSSSVGPTLLVVPMSLVGNWQREIERFAPSLAALIHHGTERLTGQEFVDQVARHDVVISTYGLIHRDLEHLAAVEWHRVALDEAQNIKNPAAKQALAVRRLHAKHRVALTGTPVENRLSDLWSIMDFLNGGYLGAAGEFRRRFAVPIERHRDSDRAERLRHLIRPFILRRLKNDPNVEVDLPEKMEMKVFCNLTKEQAALYQAVVDRMLRQIDQAGGIQRRGLILAALVKLKQICNHPAQYLADGSRLPHRSGKCDRITEMLEEVLAEGDRALVFTQFRVMGDLLEGHLKAVFNREVLFLHGGTTRKNRDRIVCRFQDPDDDAPLLILSLKAGGYGLNLTAASHVFHYDRWWNPAVEDQATDRAHRIGQDKRVQVHKFVCIGTLEERIDGLLEKKRNLADNVLGAGEEWLTELSTEKLREVIMLSREAVAED